MPKTFGVEQTYPFHARPGKVFAALTEPNLFVGGFSRRQSSNRRKGASSRFAGKRDIEWTGRFSSTLEASQ